MSPEDISEHFVESHHCKKKKKFDNFGVLSENGESRTHLGELPKKKRSRN